MEEEEELAKWTGEPGVQLGTREGEGKRMGKGRAKGKGEEAAPGGCEG